jgi:beta-lactamase superfamily II metal-dependent hydrolase
MAGELRYIDSDVVSVYELDANGKKQRLSTLLWGDDVRVVKKAGELYELDFTSRRYNQTARRYEIFRHPAYVSGKTRFRSEPVLKVRFVDVGQGDAAVIESPKGKLVLVDGGEDVHLANYVTAAWAHVLRTRAVRVAAIVVTHGDADHFAGLTRLVSASRRDVDEFPGSTRSTSGIPQPVVIADRIFHNGLVKRPGTVGDKRSLGPVVQQNGTRYATGLEQNLLSVSDDDMNEPFREWKLALAELKRRKADMTMQRLEYGDDGAFDFLKSEGLDIQVLGPITEQVNGKPALRFLRTPGSSSLSASHTINGHSIVLRLTYGNVRFLFGADLNEESEEALLERCRVDNLSLASEVLKVPHHGSADFSVRMLEAVRPVVSVVSSGDENVSKEYIHPRAGLVGALGKFSRGSVDKPLIYVTEMVAFFKRLGRISAHEYSQTDRNQETPQATHVQNAYEKTQFGVVHVRTDGERVLVATHSGRADRKEAYVFHVDATGGVQFDEEPDVV